MQYVPKLKPQEIEENHQHFSERVSLYKKRGLDFLRAREFILEKAGALQGSILEIGTGTGYTTLTLAKAGYKFITIDPDQEALKTTALNLAYENLLSCVKFFVMDGKCLDFPNSSFKNVVIVNLFHHISGVNKLLSEADRILRIDGKLILADFNRKGMKIVNSVHKEEGRIHEDFSVSKEYVYSYFHSLGYDLECYEDSYHWLIIAKKEILP